MNEILIKKITSGRLWLTIITGFVFAYAVYKQIIDNGATASIITAVFMSYFAKEKQHDGTTDTDRTST